MYIIQDIEKQLIGINCRSKCIYIIYILYNNIFSHSVSARLAGSTCLSLVAVCARRQLSNGQADRQTNRQTERQTDREADRQTGGQTNLARPAQPVHSFASACSNCMIEKLMGMTVARHEEEEEEEEEMQEQKMTGGKLSWECRVWGQGHNYSTVVRAGNVRPLVDNPNSHTDANRLFTHSTTVSLSLSLSRSHSLYVSPLPLYAVSFTRCGCRCLCARSLCCIVII